MAMSSWVNHRLLVLWVVAAALISACQPTVVGGSSCTALNCTGCCDASGTCQAGKSASSCGSAGAACSACASAQACQSGRCVSPASDGGSCGPSTCGGCCVGNACIAAAQQTDAECGGAGGACSACGSGQACDTGVGSCVTPGAASCGCFDGAAATCAGRIHSYETAHNCVVQIAAGNSKDLFVCATGQWTLAQGCTSGCNVSPAGTIDTCVQTVTAPPDAGPSCASGNGLYCGQTLGMSANTLYDCQNGVVTVRQQCTSGGQPSQCHVMPAGTADNCGCPGANGLYCGSDGLGLNANNLYQCSNGSVTLVSSCSGGCQTNPAGQSDACKGGCAGKVAGWYCGSDGLGLDPNTNYHCNGAATPDQSQPCASGCQTNAAGTDDACKQAQCPGGANGLYCGNDGLGLNANTLYQCTGGQLTAVQTCSGGCATAPAGTNDHCSNCPGGDGLYCGQDGLGLSSTNLYQCTAGTATLAQACGGTCTVNPAGVADACPGSAACPANGAAALQWERNEINSGRSWNSMCLGFVNNAFNHGAGQYIPQLQSYSAKDSLHVWQSQGRVHAWNGNPPCGSIVYWEATGSNAYWGHIVISNGNGTAVTSGWNGFGGSTHATFAWLSSMEGIQPAGYVIP